MKWKLVSVRLEIVLISMQARFTVCVERGLGSEVVLGTRWNSKATWVKWKLILLRLEMVLISAQDRCIVCAECNMGMEIILAVPDGSPGYVGQGEARFRPFGDSVSISAK